MQITSDAHDIIREIRQLDCKLVELVGDDARDDEGRKINKILASSLDKLLEMLPASQEDELLITEFALEMIENNSESDNADSLYIDIIQKIIRINC